MILLNNIFYTILKSTDFSVSSNIVTLNIHLWLQEWKRSLFLPLPKKGDLRLCSNYRTIALIPHASKILLRIIQGRLATYIEREISEEQAGFRKGRGAREEIANVRWILERAMEYGKTHIYVLHRLLHRS
jgi:hypothetical protein